MSSELMNLCYNVPGESIYGEFTTNSLVALLELIPCVEKKPILTILDIGSGSGKTLCVLGQYYDPIPCRLIGIEVSTLRADISRMVIPKKKSSNIIDWDIIERDILQLFQLPSSISMSFSFDKTFTHELMTHIVKLQLKCETLIHVITTHPPKKYYNDAHWILIARAPCRLIGSGQIITLFVYKKRF